jgi:HlyD family secretion protein
LPAIAVVAAIGTGLLSGCTEEEPAPLWGSGVLEAVEVTVASTIGGRLLDRAVGEGDTVGEGALVARLETVALTEARDLARVGLEAIRVERRQAETALAAAREQLARAERERDRVAALVAGDAAPQAQLDELETAVELARTQVESAERTFEIFPVREREITLRLASLARQIAEGTVTAPLSGTVLSEYAEPGEVLAPGQGIVRIADLRDLYVRVYIPAPLVGRVELGGEAEVRVDSHPGLVFAGRVVHIADEAEFTPKNVQTVEARADLVFAVKVAVPNPDGRLKIGLPADVDLPEIMP